MINLPASPSERPLLQPPTILLASPYAPGIKPTTLPANFFKHERLCKMQATQLCNVATPTNPTSCIRYQAQVATAAACVAPPSLNTNSRTQQLGMPPPTNQPGFAAAVMRQQRHQHGLVYLTRRITRLENKVHQAMAVIDKDTGKILNTVN
jgi:hypothetical protein